MTVAQSVIKRWRDYPPYFVRECLGATPDPWQDKVLAAFPTSPRIAMKASKGPGKSATESWLGWNFLLTRPHPKIAAVSITADNLADGLWTEMAVWQNKSELLQAAFQWKKTRIESREHPETWWMSARSFSRSATPEQQAGALAGLHQDYILFLLDETGSMPDAVMATAEAALSSCVEGHIVQAGNPTNLEGPLYRACTTGRALWHVVEINGDPDDPERSPRVSVEWARQQIEQYGRHSPWVLVNVFGQFPPASLNSLIGPDDIMAACRRSYRPEDISSSPRILGVDVAFEGDDASVIWPRQGVVAMAPMTYRNIDGIQGAGVVSRKWTDWDVNAAFIDNTGGFGAAWISQLQQLGKAPTPVGFATAALDQRYANKRAEMYFLAAEWIKNGGQLPPMDTPGMPEFTAAMTKTTYTRQGDRLLMEPKKMVKQKLTYSPDHADAFVLTFAFPVANRDARGGRGHHQYQYDPFANPGFGRGLGNAVAGSYDPVWGA